MVKAKKSRLPPARPSKLQHYANIEAVDGGDTEALHKKLRRYTNDWMESSDARELSEIFDQIFAFEPSLSIHKIVCVALGSPSGGSLSTWKQFGCLMDLRNRFFPTARVIFQDPIFSETDRALLEELNICVMESPAAFDEIDERTFLFAPHCEHEQFCDTLDGREIPGLCITNDAQQYIRNFDIRRVTGVHVGLERIHVAQRIEESMRKREFPGNGRLEWYSTVIYSLRSDE